MADLKDWCRGSSPPGVDGVVDVLVHVSEYAIHVTPGDPPVPSQTPGMKEVRRARREPSLFDCLTFLKNDHFSSSL